MPTKELVIAAYDKDISWTEIVDESIKITIYKKGNVRSYPKEIVLPKNVGRCVHSFFTHIYERYNTLSDYTFFVQDYPFDHWGNLLPVLHSDVAFYHQLATLKFGGYFGFHNNTLGTAWRLSDAKQFGEGAGKVLVCKSNGIPQANPNIFDIRLDEYWKTFFEGTPPTEYEFMPGGHFAITKEQVRTRSRNFYKAIVDKLENDEKSPWNIERIECYLFNENYKTTI